MLLGSAPGTEQVWRPEDSPKAALPGAAVSTRDGRGDVGGAGGAALDEGCGTFPKSRAARRELAKARPELLDSFFQQKPPRFHQKGKKPPRESELLSTAGSPHCSGLVKINPDIKSRIRPSGTWKCLRVYGPCKEPELAGAASAPGMPLERARFSSRLSGKAPGS